MACTPINLKGGFGSPPLVKGRVTELSTYRVKETCTFIFCMCASSSSLEGHFQKCRCDVLNCCFWYDTRHVPLSLYSSYPSNYLPMAKDIIETFPTLREDMTQLKATVSKQAINIGQPAVFPTCWMFIVYLPFGTNEALMMKRDWLIDGMLIIARVTVRRCVRVCVWGCAGKTHWLTRREFCSSVKLFKH